MFEPNQLEYFYANEETSSKIFSIDHTLNRVYNFLLLTVGTALTIALALHLKQSKEMH